MGDVLTDVRWRVLCAWNWLVAYSGESMRYEWREQYGEADDFTPGEMPLSVLKTIAKHAGFYTGARVLDLGCGRGTALAYWALANAITPLGIDALSTVVESAEKLLSTLSVNRSIVEGNFLNIDWPDAEFIVCSTTCFSQPALHQFHDRLERLKPGITVIQISNPQTVQGFKIVWEGIETFPWGRCPITIKKRI